jgi:hypothetical protein
VTALPCCVYLITDVALSRLNPGTQDIAGRSTPTDDRLTHPVQLLLGKRYVASPGETLATGKKHRESGLSSPSASSEERATRCAGRWPSMSIGQRSPGSTPGFKPLRGRPAWVRHHTGALAIGDAEIHDDLSGNVSPIRLCLLTESGVRAFERRIVATTRSKSCTGSSTPTRLSRRVP